MELGLKGRNAVITGGTRGIGKSIARALAKEGVNVVLLARSKEALERTADEIRRESGVQALGIPADVKSIKSVKAAAADTVGQFRTIHILVNNAGGPIRRMDRQIEWPDTDWMDDINMKIVGMLRCVQAFLPNLARDGTGRVINISGIAGVGVLSGALTHGFNNSAMNHVTTYLAADLADDNITVNTVVPGLIATEWRELWAENMARQQGKTKAEFLNDTCRNWGIVAGRWGTMEEVADSVVFLASDRARYITGAQLSVDGGFSVNKR
ncbi:MAG TPA: SDR family oxidoreductase [Terriglobia bacterium]|nr:SDR family oxidoreductase [Terriglobia bacterium]